MAAGEIVSEHDEDDTAVVIDHDVTNEGIVLAAVLVDEDLRNELVPKTPTDRFRDTDYAVTWEAIRRLIAKKKGFDLQLLHKEVAGKVRLSLLKNLMSTYPDPPVDMDTHLNALNWDSTRARAVEDSIPSFLRALRDNEEKPATVHALAERVARSLVVTTDKSFMHNSKHLAAQQRLEIEKRRSQGACYEYGIKELDFYPNGEHRCIPGAAPGKITNLTAVSGSGKSVLAAYLGLQQARKGRKVLYGAWEMGPGDTLEVMATISFHLPDLGVEGETSLGSRYASSTGALNEDELDTLEDRMEKIGEYVKFFDPPFAHDMGRKYTNDDALMELHRMVVDSGCEVVVYDLLERMFPDGSPGEERRALFAFQQIHILTDTHAIICTQQKLKEVEKSGDKRPTRSTILGSQAWVDISDTIIGVHLPARWKPIADDTMELLLLKQRFGKWPQAMSFQWDGDAMSIENGRDVDFDHGDAGGGVF